MQAEMDVEWAVNGQAAANAFAQAAHDARPFDAVLMDCNMPVCDGFRATAMIREHEAEQSQERVAQGLLAGAAGVAAAAAGAAGAAGAAAGGGGGGAGGSARPVHTPIIALTAYAMKDDQRRCLSAGMDSFLTKPVSKKRLLRHVLATVSRVRAAYGGGSLATLSAAASLASASLHSGSGSHSHSHSSSSMGAAQPTGGAGAAGPPTSDAEYLEMLLREGDDSVGAGGGAGAARAATAAATAKKSSVGSSDCALSSCPSDGGMAALDLLDDDGHDYDQVTTRDLLVGGFHATGGAAPSASLAAAVRTNADRFTPQKPTRSLGTTHSSSGWGGVSASAASAASGSISSSAAPLQQQQQQQQQQQRSQRVRVQQLSPSDDSRRMQLSAAPIDAQLGLAQFGGNHAVWQRMLGKFATDYLPRGIATMRAAQAQWDIVTLRMEAHSLKGSCGFVGAAQLADLCARLMATCGLDGELREWQKRFITQVVSQVEAEYFILNAYFETEHDFSLDPVDGGGGAANASAAPSDDAMSASSAAAGGGGGGAHARASSTPERLVRGARLLLAEDNPFTVDVLRNLLHDARVTAVTVVETGDAAVAAYVASPESFDVIVMDYLLPGLDGAAATRRIRAAEAEAAAAAAAAGGAAGGGQRRHVPIVGLTANNLHKEKALESGMDAFATKPISRQALIAIVAQVLQPRLEGSEGASRGGSGGAGGGGTAAAVIGTDDAGATGVGAMGAQAADANSVAAFEAELRNTADADVLDAKRGARNLGGGMATLVPYLNRFAGSELNECMDAIHAGQESGDATKLHHVSCPLLAPSPPMLL
jgi:CheY-like chemotaxis protein